MIVYIAGPMTPKDGFTAEQNAAQGVEAWLALARAGVPCFCPQMACCIPNFESINEGGYDLWLRFDFACVDASTHVLMLPRWEDSKGASMEHDYATSIGKKVLYSFEAVLAEAAEARK